MTDSTPTNSTSPNQLRDPDIFWLHRWLALKETIQTTRKDTKEPFKGLLCNLFEFGQKQFLYFFLGFTHNSVDSENEALFKKALDDFKQRQPKLIKDYGYPPEYVLRTILDQIAVDFEIIQRAMHQRQHGTPDQQKTLNLADKWGQGLLGSVKKMFEFSHGGKTVSLQPTVIAYFNRSPLIRMIPYDNVALIGIPLTATQPGHRRDLLVIGHELGHYAYWHGQVNDQSIREILKYIVRGEMPYIKNWIEEIFADVFGLVISQQLAMLPWALEMIFDNVPSSFIRDNRSHPIDALRPYLFLDLLLLIIKRFRKQTESNQKAEKEEINGNNRIIKPFMSDTERRQINKGGHIHFETENRLGRNVTVEISEAIITQQSVIEEIIEKIFEEIYDFSNWEAILDLTKYFLPVGKLTQSPIPNTRDSAFKLMQYFLETFPDIKRYIEDVNNINEEINREENRTSWNTTFEEALACISQLDETAAADKRTDTANAIVKHNFITIRRIGFRGAVEPEVWKIVFAADGWTVKGPETQPVGGWEGEPSGGHNPFHL